MDNAYNNIKKSIEHLKTLDEIYQTKTYKNKSNKNEFEIYNDSLRELNNSFKELGLYDELYSEKNRQMVLADIIEYIILGRGFYSIGTGKTDTKKNKGLFIKGVLNLVNILMVFETITVDTDLRKKFLTKVSRKINEIKDEELFNELKDFSGEIGMPSSKANKKLSKYFDKFLPKTAGGLWHELLVYIFMLRNNLGYIIPLLLHQKFYSLDDHIVPPDFLIISHDKRLFGVEVGIKKEIQSGSFSLKTAIPTATIDTINSRNSDRCPICKKWIEFCPYIIEKYSQTENVIKNIKVKCLKECNKYSKEDIVNGKCKYSKYSRKKTKSKHTMHDYSDGKHYHYYCVLNSVKAKIRNEIIKAQDYVAIKTHYPYYSGLEELKGK